LNKHKTGDFSAYPHEYYIIPMYAVAFPPQLAGALLVLIPTRRPNEAHRKPKNHL